MKLRNTSEVSKSARSFKHQKSPAYQILDVDRKRVFGKIAHLRDISFLKDYRQPGKNSDDYSLPNDINFVIEAASLDSFLLPDSKDQYETEFYIKRNLTGRQYIENLAKWFRGMCHNYINKPNTNIEITKAILVVAIKEIVRQISQESNLRGKLLWKIFKKQILVWNSYVEDLKNSLNTEKDKNSVIVNNLRFMFHQKYQKLKKRLDESNSYSNELKQENIKLINKVNELSNEIDIKSRLYTQLLNSQDSSELKNQKEDMTIDKLAYLEKNIRINYQTYRDLEDKINNAKEELRNINKQKARIEIPPVEIPTLNTESPRKSHPAMKLFRSLTLKNLNINEFRATVMVEHILATLHKIYQSCQVEQLYNNNDFPIFVYDYYAKKQKKHMKERKLKIFILACAKNSEMKRINLFLRCLGLGHLIQSSNFTINTLKLFLKCYQRIMRDIHQESLNSVLEIPVIELPTALDCIDFLPQEFPKELVQRDFEGNAKEIDSFTVIEVDYVLQKLCEYHSELEDEI